MRRLVLALLAVTACGKESGAAPSQAPIDPLTTACTPDLCGYSTPPVRVTSGFGSLQTIWWTCECYPQWAQHTAH